MKNTVMLAVVAAALSLGALAACGPQPVCAAIPSCEQNEVSSTTACTSAETTCRKVEVCTSIIYCRPGTADAGP